MKGIRRRSFLKTAGVLSLGLPLKRAIRQVKGQAVHEPGPDPWMEIHLGNIAWNLSQIRKKVKRRPVMAVVKANAYGHGLVPVAKYLAEQNIDALAVGKIEEALEIRESGVHAPILNFGPFSDARAKEIVRERIGQSVFTEDAFRLADVARALGKKASVHIKIDTGLGRVGVPHGKALDFIDRISKRSELVIEGIFTTFTEEPDYDRVQLKRFLSICRQAADKGIATGRRHAASSAAILAFPDAHLDMVRPGITLYGHYPSDAEDRARKIDLRAAMTLKASITMIKNLMPGDSVSYHRVFTTERRMRVATLPAGYSDGYPWQAGTNGDVLIGGQKCRVLAAATSNHLIADVTKIGDIDSHDGAVLIGPQGGEEIRAEDVAAWAGSSVYKIVMGMNPNLPRIYLE